MDKLKMHSKDLTQDNLAKIQAAFPNCVTERQNAQGEIELAIDFDLLRQELSGNIVEGPQERYRLDWPGKREAMLAANAPIAKTLRPARDESVNFDSTENLFIEGDNLDALKLLQETYLGKVKMIYIDPPYNTGNDFVYEDDFTENTEAFLQRSNQKDEQGNRLVSNTESNGRFHSDWLSMMLSRLKLAQSLLRDDGVIFISIDDNEQAALKKLCDELFSDKNLVGQFTWETKRAARGVPPKTLLMHNHEYVLCYAKDLEKIKFKGLPRDEADFGNPDSDPRGLWRSESIRATGGQDNYFTITNPSNHYEYYGNWAFSKARIEKMIKEELILFPKDKAGTPRQKKFIDSYVNATKAGVTSLGWHSTETATNQLLKIFDQQKFFDFPKPLTLISYLVNQALTPQDILLDFFAGSATSAHSVMQLNAEDGGNRKFIMVQLPEEVEEKHAAYKAGYKTIAEISKERIRRAGAQILEGKCHADWNKDIGFRVLKVDTSNMQDVYYQPQQLSQDDLFASVDNIKPDRSSEDLLFQVLLDWGVDLTLPIRRETGTCQPHLNQFFNN